MARTKTKNKKELPILPEDIIHVILLKLPVKSIYRFKCVCKRWHKLFKSTEFIKKHLQHAIQNNKFTVLLGSVRDSYTIDFDGISSSNHILVQTKLPCNTCVNDHLPSVSCDGLICLPSYFSDEDTILWNPSTGESSKKIWISKISYRSIQNAYGVCYDWKIDGYKLLRIVPDSRRSCSEVWVRPLGSGSWYSIGNIPCDISIDTNISNKPLNGIIHWIGKSKVIGSFDIVEERYKEIKIPSCYLQDETYRFRDMEVGVLGEELYFSVHGTCLTSNIDLWVMKDYGVIDSWTQIFSCSKDDTCYESLRPLHYFNKNREILLQGKRLQRYYNGQNALVSYNPKNPKKRRLKTLVIPGIPKYFSATSFVGSLFW